MSNLKVRLTKDQVAFLVKMTELNDPSEAMKRFAQIMMEEGLNPSEMSKVIDIIMTRMARK